MDENQESKRRHQHGECHHVRMDADFRSRFWISTRFCEGDDRDCVVMSSRFGVTQE
jgi:hypothetical protein